MKSNQDSKSKSKKKVATTTKKGTTDTIENRAKAIRSVCSPCGIAANVLTCLKKYGYAPLKLAFNISTFHISKEGCQVCGNKKVHVTEARDFFYPDFSLLLKEMERFKRRKKMKVEKLQKKVS